MSPLVVFAFAVCSVLVVETTWRFKPHDALIRIVAGAALEEAMKEAHRSGAVSRAYAVPLPSQTVLAGEGVSHVCPLVRAQTANRDRWPTLNWALSG